MDLTLSFAVIGGFVVATLGAAVGGWVWYTGSVEQPAYVSVTLDGAVEVRDYPNLVIAEVSTTGDRWEAVRQGFRPLARYIFAKERGGDSIAMTAPVTQRPRSSTADSGVGSSEWAIRFVMPSAYRLEALPEPWNPAVRLEALPAGRRAAIRFSGVATDELLAAKTTELRAWMERNDLVPDGPPTYAYYNDPWTPGFLRRNEVMFDVASR